MQDDQQRRKTKRVRGETVKREQHRRKHADSQSKDGGKDVRNSHQLFGIVCGLGVIRRTHTLPNHRDHCKVHRMDDNHSDLIHAVRNAVCRDLNRAEARHNAGGQHLVQREQAVFHTVRHSDVQDAADERRIPHQNVFRYANNCGQAVLCSNPSFCNVLSDFSIR